MTSVISLMDGGGGGGSVLSVSFRAALSVAVVPLDSPGVAYAAGLLVLLVLLAFGPQSESPPAYPIRGHSSCRRRASVTAGSSG